MGQRPNTDHQHLWVYCFEGCVTCLCPPDTICQYVTIERLTKKLSIFFCKMVSFFWNFYRWSARSTFSCLESFDWPTELGVVLSRRHGRGRREPLDFQRLGTLESLPNCQPPSNFWTPRTWFQSLKNLQKIKIKIQFPDLEEWSDTSQCLVPENEFKFVGRPCI